MLSGEYKPPLGVVGEAFDAVIGKRIAEATCSDAARDAAARARGGFLRGQRDDRGNAEPDIMLRVWAHRRDRLGKKRGSADVRAARRDDYRRRSACARSCRARDAGLYRDCRAVAAGDSQWRDRSRRAGCDRIRRCRRARSARTPSFIPRVRARAAEIEHRSRRGHRRACRPLLFEGDYWKECDATIVVIAPVETRIARVQARDGVSREDVATPDGCANRSGSRARRATYVIENAGERSELEAASRAVWSSLQDRNYQTPGQTGR